MIKLERRCPRCHKHLYHMVSTESLRRGSRKAKVHCADCGHPWIGIIKQTDYTNEELEDVIKEWEENHPAEGQEA